MHLKFPLEASLLGSFICVPVVRPVSTSEMQQKQEENNLSWMISPFHPPAWAASRRRHFCSPWWAQQTSRHPLCRGSTPEQTGRNKRTNMLGKTETGCLKITIILSSIHISWCFPFNSPSMKWTLNKRWQESFLLGSLCQQRDLRENRGLCVFLVMSTWITMVRKVVGTNHLWEQFLTDQECSHSDRCNYKTVSGRTEVWRKGSSWPQMSLLPHTFIELMAIKKSYIYLFPRGQHIVL